MSRIVRAVSIRLALISMGAGLAVSGLVLLLRAAWMALALALGAMWASVVMGAGLMLVGALVVFLSLRHRRRRGPSDTELIALISEAFFDGLAAGRSVRHRSGGAGD